jgi:NAD(P)-dependent dehydrogenase (short-subunit alcohol dehydrogenase family)
MRTTPPLVALVTGSTRGIGFETARQLGEAGFHVVVNGRDAVQVDAAVTALHSTGLTATALPFDVADPVEVEHAVRRLQQSTGRLDVLVNNAGVRVEEYHRRPSEQPLDDWRTTFETNLFGTVTTTQAFLPLLMQAPAARIVNVSSLLGSVTTHTDRASYAYSDMFKSLPAYSASKSAVNSWTVHLAYELRETAIKVNAAHPGYTQTSMNDGAGDQSAEEGARTAVSLALLPSDGPSGAFVHLDGTIPW